MRAPWTGERSARSRMLPIAACLSLLAAAPVPPTGGGIGPGFRIQAPVRTVLKNGLTLLVLARRSIPLVELQLMVKSGSTSDAPGKEGTAALVARLLKRGTRSRPAEQFFEEAEFVGGSIDTATSPDATYVRGEFASRDVEMGFNLLADLVLNPAFRPEELAKEKRQAQAEIAERLDDPERVVGLAFASWLYGTHPYGRPVDGTERSLKGITRDDIVAFYERQYTPNNAVLVVAGDIDVGQTAQRAERYFSTWKRKIVPELKLTDPLPVRGRKVLLIDKPDATQSQIRLGNIAIKRSDPDYFPLLVANAILGGGYTSWLTDEVRVKRGLTYSIDSWVDARRAAGDFYVTTFSKNASVLETIKVSLEQVGRLRGGELPAEDLQKSRNYLSGLYPLRVESPDDLASEFLNIELHGLDADFINQYQRRVRSVGADAVKRVAARFPLQDLAMVVVGPAQELRKDLETLGPVTVRSLQSVLEGPAPAAR